MRFIPFILFIFFLTSCIETENKELASDPLLEKIAGKDYASMIEIPTNEEGDVDSLKMARISFDHQVFDFDTIYEGDIIRHSFNFTNIGIKSLYLLQTNSSCGCTVGRYSKDAIEPGKKGVLDIEFNSSGKSGKQQRKIALITNAYPSEIIMEMRGFVKQNNN